MRTAFAPGMTLLLALALLASGCPGEGDTTTVYVTVAKASRFPGGTVEANNLAADGLAFSESGHTLTGFTVGTNHSNGDTLYLYTTNSGSCDHLWASYFNGTAFTPPVEIQGKLNNPSAGVSLGTALVLWLNTAGLAATAGASRNGDAIILFRRQELEAGVGDNDRLYSFYFDRSSATTPVHATNANIRYGFDTVADLVDTDNDYGVETFGALSDAFLCHLETLRFSPSGGGMKFTGDPTTFVGAFWTKPTSLGGRQLWSANFDLSDVNANSVFGAEALFTPAAAAAMDGDDAFGQSFAAENGNLFFVVELNGEEPGARNHRLLEWAKWSSGALVNATILSRTDTANTVTAEMPEWVFGADCGLGRLYAVGRERGYEGTTSPVNGDWDLMLYIIDTAASTVQTAEIDNATGLPTDPALDAGDLHADMSRDGSWFAVGWRQLYDSASTSCNCLFMRGVQTVPSGGTGRTIAQSITPIVRMNWDYQSATLYANVEAWDAPENQMYKLGNQSDLHRMNVLFVQEPDSADLDNYQLRTSWMGITLDTTGAAAPAVPAGPGTQAADRLVWENDRDHTFWGNPWDILSHARAVDAGSGGNVFVYFIGDGDGDSLVETGTDPEARLFFWNGLAASPTAVEISGDGAGQNTLGFTDARQVEEFNVCVAPFHSGTSEFAGRYQHIYMREDRSAPGTELALRYRCYDTQAAGATTGFWPLLTEQPKTIDTGEPGEAQMDLNFIPFITATSTAAVFRQNDHVWYNEYSAGGTWFEKDGLPDPALVDDNDEHPIIFYFTWVPFVIPTAGEADLVSRTMVFFAKMDPVSGDSRMYVRVRN
jgi:hypothetical protein